MLFVEAGGVGGRYLSVALSSMAASLGRGEAAQARNADYSRRSPLRGCPASSAHHPNLAGRIGPWNRVISMAALSRDLLTQAMNRQRCFLVASALAWFEVCHGWAGWRPRSWSWWITLANLAGSVAFGVSAVAGYINPATGQLHNAERSNLGTFVGAVCFFVGALLLLPERTGEVSDAVTTAATSGG
jgi:hypothetical protein